MFNIERELEVSNGLQVKSVELTNDGIEAHLLYADGDYYGVYYFDPATGVRTDHIGKDKAWRLRPKSEMRPIDHFFLHAGERAWPKSDWIKLEFEHHRDGATAATRTKEHNQKASEAQSPFRFMVKKEVELSPVRDFENWAKERFELGDWTPVPWANEAFALEEGVKHHFAHLSKTDDCKIAFWPTEGDAQRDDVTVMNPGRYLREYFSHVLSETEVRDWAVKVDVEAELRFVHTADEFYEAYRGPNQGGLQSCMVYRDDEVSPHTGRRWDCGTNPVRVYAAGDLAMALLERKGKMIGRALVWPEKLVAGRIYGDIERMTMALEAAGYMIDCATHNVESKGRGGLNGARIKKVRPEGHPYNYIMPYVDFGYGVSPIEGDDEHWQLSRSPHYTALQINGLLFEKGEEPERPTDEAETCNCDDCQLSRGDMFRCDRCGDAEDIDDSNTVSGEHQWCDHCVSNYSTSCDACGEYQRDTDITYTGDGHSYCSGCLSANTTSCDYCGEYFRSGVIEPVYDARYTLPEGAAPVDHADVYNDACASCIEHDEDIQRDVNGLWVDVDTCQSCEDCGSRFSTNLNEDECPSETCVQARANTEVEPAE